MPAHDKTLSFRTSELIHVWLTKRAAANGRSINSELNQIIKKLMEEEEQKKGK